MYSVCIDRCTGAVNQVIDLVTLQLSEEWLTDYVNLFPFCVCKDRLIVVPEK